MYENFKKVVLGFLVHVTPSNFFRTIFRSEALVYKSCFFQISRSMEIIYLLFIYYLFRFSYNHCNYSHVCLLVKMASKNRDKVYGIYGFVMGRIMNTPLRDGAFMPFWSETGCRFYFLWSENW